MIIGYHQDTERWLVITDRRATLYEGGAWWIVTRLDDGGVGWKLGAISPTREEAGRFSVLSAGWGAQLSILAEERVWLYPHRDYIVRRLVECVLYLHEDEVVRVMQQSEKLWALVPDDCTAASL